MKLPLFGCVAFAYATTAFAQTGAPTSTSPTSANQANQTITLSGCVNRDPTGHVTLTDADNGTTYRLTGKSLRRYVGRSVQIVGDSRRVTIKGGLLPSANAAAQAGALDPARAAVAASPGGTETGTGVVKLPEFRVNRVQPVAGECP